MAQGGAYVPASRNTTLIESLRDQPNFLMEEYNRKQKAENEKKGIRKAGGVYIPPHKLKAMQEELLESDPAGEAHQRMMWELLRKSINGIVNKVNIANIQNVVVELFNENILRGRGLLARALIKAQMASPNFTHVYAALIAVVNTKVPEIGLLVSKRVLIQFQRSYSRNSKLVCVATIRMIAHLVNQRVLGEYVALQILVILLNHPTEDSVEIACDFMIEVGQVLSEVTPAGATAIFDSFKSLLHQAEIGQKAQYSIENLFAVRKTGFKEKPGVIPELDLIQLEDQITHQLDLDDQLQGEEKLNLFMFDANYLANQQQWDLTKQEILGEENIARLKQPDDVPDEYDEPQPEEGIQDLTEQDLVNLRKTIYLALQSTLNFQECAHKMLKSNLAKGHQHELVDMILECCMMERIYQTFFGLLAERFCRIDDKFKSLFEQAFLSHYNNIFNQEANKIRNLAHLYGHLFFRKAIDWTILQPIRMSPETTTAAARMFLKILLKYIAEHMGIDEMAKEFQEEETRKAFEGMFPLDNPNDLRFAINYYTTIGLGKLTEEMREVLSLHEEIINERRKQEEERQAQMLLQEEEEMLKLELEEKRARELEAKLARDKEKEEWCRKMEEEKAYQRRQRRTKKEGRRISSSREKKYKEKGRREERSQRREQKRRGERSRERKNRRRRRSSSSSSDTPVRGKGREEKRQTRGEKVVRNRLPSHSSSSSSSGIDSSSSSGSESEVVGRGKNAESSRSESSSRGRVRRGRRHSDSS